MTDGIVGGIVADPPIGADFGAGQGIAGPPGTSAYDVAIANGFVGTEAQWLASLATGGIVEHNYAIAIATRGQTILPISPPPTTLSTLLLEVNGISYRAPLALSATETAITWTGGFPLDPVDDVHVSYF